MRASVLQKLKERGVGVDPRKLSKKLRMDEEKEYPLQEQNETAQIIWGKQTPLRNLTF
jgi:hypothetical protein